MEVSDMAKYKIGITERGDAGLDFSWADKLDTVDGAILITKKITPAFIDMVMANPQKLVVHATCTGFGGTMLEPNVPKPEEQFSAVLALVQAGFPKNHIVIRVDPIIPTEKGLERALSTIEMFMDEGFSRYRISIIDMYKHVRERFKASGLLLPYGPGFAPTKEQVEMVDAMLLEAREYWSIQNNGAYDLRIEVCAERVKNALPCGCIAALDLAIMRLDSRDSDSSGYQRKGCMCYSGKTELLSCKHPCQNQCLYCYWKREGEQA